MCNLYIIAAIIKSGREKFPQKSKGKKMARRKSWKQRFKVSLAEYERLKECERHIYFALCEGGEVDGLIKIGAAYNLATRINTVRCDVGTNLRVLAVASVGNIGGAVIEAHAHSLFADHLAYKKEWYQPSPAIFDMIDRLNGNPLALVAHYEMQSTAAVSTGEAA